MSSNAVISAQIRKVFGKGPARYARRNNQTPGVLYGGNEDPISLLFENKELNNEIKKAGFLSRIYEIDLDGKVQTVLAREVQYHPVSDIPLHVDFLRVTENTRITVEVEVRFVDEAEAPGLKRGGVLNVVRRKVELSCLASSIPNFIEAKLAGLEIGDSVRINDINLPEGTKPVIQRDFIIATIAAPTVAIEETTESETTDETESESDEKDSVNENDKEKASE